LFQQLIDLFHRIYDVQGLVAWGGLAGLLAIIFSETGLMVGFFLPGDSLLVTAGIFCSSHNPTGKPLLDLVHVSLLVPLAAILGVNTGYYIGSRTGPRLFTREDSLFFSKRHVLRTKAFYEKHGGKTIIIGQFMPIIRTFAPLVAGVGQMNYRRFFGYSIFGGFFWVLSMVWLGYGLAVRFPAITKHIDKLIILIIFVSLLPAMIGWARARLQARREARLQGDTRRPR
jgi:membrane-associated protein